MRFSMHLIHAVVLALALSVAGGREIEVSSTSALENTLAASGPGDVILLADGVYDGTGCVLNATGAAARPVVIRARTRGGARFTCPVQLLGDHLTLDGIRFTDNSQLFVRGTGCRVTRCTMNDLEPNLWFRVHEDSRNIEIDHCLFENKPNKTRHGSNNQLVQVVVRNEGEAHRIHHNHFRDVTKGDGNGFETLQLITHGNPFDPPPGHCSAIIEDNLFERCNGESEIISVKSNGNMLRRNTFRACLGGLVLRHGDDNVAEGNDFFGEGEPAAGGVRLQGTDQVVRNNYFRDLPIFGVSMMDGTPDGLYIRTGRARVESNTFVNCRPALHIGANHSLHPNGTVPRDCVIAGNLFVNDATGEVLVEYVQGDEPEGWTWRDNLARGNFGIPMPEGVRKTETIPKEIERTPLTPAEVGPDAG